MSEPHVVIIGGGFGGLSAAKALRKRKPQVTLLDRRNHHVFQPLLYQVAAAALSPGDIAAPIRWVLRRRRNVRVLLAEVARIDVARATGCARRRRRVEYDYLIVAPGASHAYFGHPEWEPFAPGLKTLEDALEIRRRVLLAFERAERETDPARRRELLTFVLVGGGPTGVELAGTLAEIARQTLRDEFRSIDTSAPASSSSRRADDAGVVSREAPRRGPRALIRLGVEMREQTTVTGVDAHGVWLGQERLDAGTILWAAGVAASPLVATLGSRSIAPGAWSSSPICRFRGIPKSSSSVMLPRFYQDGQLLPGVAQTAIQGAAHAAKNILRRGRGEPITTFVYRDLGNMAIIGRGSAVADIGRLHFSGPLAGCSGCFSTSSS